MSANVHPTGIHHLAVMTGDMKSQIEFFSDVLGCRAASMLSSNCQKFVSSAWSSCPKPRVLKQ